jgi:hypothetical protein
MDLTAHGLEALMRSWCWLGLTANKRIVTEARYGSPGRQFDWSSSIHLESDSLVVTWSFSRCVPPGLVDIEVPHAITLRIADARRLVPPDDAVLQSCIDEARRLLGEMDGHDMVSTAFGFSVFCPSLVPPGGTDASRTIDISPDSKLFFQTHLV